MSRNQKRLKYFDGFFDGFESFNEFFDEFFDEFFMAEDDPKEVELLFCLSLLEEDWDCPVKIRKKSWKKIRENMSRIS